MRFGAKHAVPRPSTLVLSASTNVQGVIVKPPNKGLLRWVKRVWRQLKREQLTPGRFGFAVGLGLFFGLSPFWGFQMITAQFLAYVLKLNKLAVAAGVT